MPFLTSALLGGTALAAGAGAASGKGSSPQGNVVTNTTQNASGTSGTAPLPWYEQAGQYTFGQARRLAKQMKGWEPFPDPTYVGFDPSTEQALRQVRGLASAGSPVVPAAEESLAATLRGEYLDPDTNPYLQGTYERAAAAALPGVVSGFAGANRTGSGAYANAVTQARANLANQIYGGNYQAERDRMLRAQVFAPQTQALRYADAGELAKVGAAREAKAGEELRDRIYRFEFPRNIARERVGILTGALGALSPFAGFGTRTFDTTSTGSRAVPYYENPTAQGIGAGLGALGLGLEAYRAFA